jgi:ribosomal protein S24E
MKIKILEKKHNPFLKREELRIEIEHERETTPSLSHLQQAISKEIGKGADHVDIRNIFSFRGASKSSSKVFVWEEKHVKKKKEPVKEEPVKEEKKE